MARPVPAGVPGKSRATLHRQRNPEPSAAPAERRAFHHPAELSREEKERVLAMLDSPRFADKAARRPGVHDPAG
jgi:hypothetical protein